MGEGIIHNKTTMLSLRVHVYCLTLDRMRVGREPLTPTRLDPPRLLIIPLYSQVSGGGSGLVSAALYSIDCARQHEICAPPQTPTPRPPNQVDFVWSVRGPSLVDAFESELQVQGKHMHFDIYIYMYIYIYICIYIYIYIYI